MLFFLCQQRRFLLKKNRFFWLNSEQVAAYLSDIAGSIAGQLSNFDGSADEVNCDELKDDLNEALGLIDKWQKLRKAEKTA